MEQILIYSLLIGIFLVLASKLYLSSRHKNLPPSPLGLPILGHVHLLKEPLHRTFLNLSQKYGPIFSVMLGSRRLVVISSPSAVQECFTKNDIVFANRPRFALGKYVGYNYTNLILASNGDHWRNLRRICNVEIFASNRLNMSSDIRRDEVNRLLSRLYQVSANGFAKVQLKSLFSDLTLNIALRMIAGNKRYFGEEVNSEEARRFQEVIKETLELALSSYPGDSLPVLQLIDYNGYIKRIKNLGNKADELLQGMVDEHRTNKGDSKLKNSMIAHLLSLQESQPEYYTDIIIKGLIQAILIAGTDTTTATLEWALSNLLNHRHVLNKARDELNKIVGEDKLVEESDLSNLPYLQNIISETLRLYPGIPLLLPHLSSDKCSIGGYEIPKETILLVNAWAIQRDPELWEDPTSFKPERFENNKYKEMSYQNQIAYRLLPFGLGRRACPGMGLAQIVLGLTLGSLIQCFEWERVSEKEIDMTEGPGRTLPKLEPLEALCKATTTTSKVLSPVV